MSGMQGIGMVEDPVTCWYSNVIAYSRNNIQLSISIDSITRFTRIPTHGLCKFPNIKVNRLRTPRADHQHQQPGFGFEHCSHRKPWAAQAMIPPWVRPAAAVGTANLVVKLGMPSEWTTMTMCWKETFQCLFDTRIQKKLRLLNDFLGGSQIIPLVMSGYYPTLG